MGSILRVRNGLKQILGFTLLLLLIHLSKSKAASSLGTCFRIRYKNPNSCGRLLRSEVSRGRCCTGHHRRAWGPGATSPTPTQGQRQTHGGGGGGTSAGNASSAASLPSLTWLAGGGGRRRGLATDAAQDCQPCNTSCQETRCGEDKKCVLRNGIPKCVCSPKCHLKHKSAVCGTDGRTYSSECQLLKRSCQKKQLLFVAHSGACQTCNGVRCRRNRTCVLDELLVPRCIRCPQSCRPKASKRRAICGTDGVTYDSKCFLKLASCEAGQSISRVYKGQCVKNAQCHTVRCWSGETCLHNFATKKPQCLLCGDLPACAASALTPHICAADKTTYQSRCALQHASCRTKKVLTAIPLQLCAKNVTMIKMHKKKKCDSPLKTKRKKAKSYRMILNMEESEDGETVNATRSKVGNEVDLGRRSRSKLRRKMGLSKEAKRRRRRRRKRRKRKKERRRDDC